MFPNGSGFGNNYYPNQNNQQPNQSDPLFNYISNLSPINNPYGFPTNQFPVQHNPFGIQQNLFGVQGTQYGVQQTSTPPEVVPDTPPEQQPSNVPQPSQPRRRSHKKKDAGAPKVTKVRNPWTPEDYKMLTRCWLDTSEDPVLCKDLNSFLK